MNKDQIIVLGSIAAGVAGLYLLNKQGLLSRGALIVTGKISDDPKAIAAGFIAQQEGFSATAYPDPRGQSVKYSIGYGHQITGSDGFDASSEVDEPTALQLLY